MPRDVQAIRHDLLTALQEIGAFVEGKSLAELQSDRPLQLVLEREFEILGESFYRLRNAHPELFETIPGAHRIIGMRNIIAHGYDSVDYEILWDAATRDLALLAKAVESLPDSGPVPRDRPRYPQQPDAPA